MNQEPTGRSAGHLTTPHPDMATPHFL